MYSKRLITGNCLPQLWRLASLIICTASQQAKDPEKLMVKIQSEGQQTQDGRRADISIWVWRQGKKSQCPSLKAIREKEFLLRGESDFLLYSGLQLIRWDPPTSGWAICFTQSNNLNIHLIQKHLHRHTWNHVWPNIWAPHDSVNLTHKIGHHTNWNENCSILKYWNPPTSLDPMGINKPKPTHLWPELLRCPPNASPNSILIPSDPDLGLQTG